MTPKRTNAPVVLADRTVEALKALGWTPPGAAPGFDPEMLREMASRLLTAANEAEAAR